MERNLFHNTCVVEVGSIEVNSSFTRLSSSLRDAKSAHDAAHLKFEACHFQTQPSDKAIF